jgi:hypothetical protein
LSRFEENARALRNVNASSWCRFCVDQIRAHSFSKKFDRIWHADNSSHLRRRKTVLESNTRFESSDWHQIEMKNTRQKHSKKMITQTLRLFRLIVFIWNTCFVKTQWIYKTIIKSIVTYASIIWHASYKRSNSVVDTTTKLVKMR